MKKGAVRRLLHFGNRPALFAGDLGRALDRIAQERRHVVGEARAAAFRLALTLARRSGRCSTLAARLSGGLGSACRCAAVGAEPPLRHAAGSPLSRTGRTRLLRARAPRAAGLLGALFIRAAARGAARVARAVARHAAARQPRLPAAAHAARRHAARRHLARARRGDPCRRPAPAPERHCGHRVHAGDQHGRRGRARFLPASAKSSSDGGSPSQATGSPSIFSMSFSDLSSSSVTSDSRDAFLAGAAGAADAVHVVVRLPRQVEVEDVADVGDVEAARGDVARRQQLRSRRRGTCRASPCAPSGPCRRAGRRR